MSDLFNTLPKVHYIERQWGGVWCLTHGCWYEKCVGRHEAVIDTDEGRDIHTHDPLEADDE